jgi:hypothetical protein
MIRVLYLLLVDTRQCEAVLFKQQGKIAAEEARFVSEGSQVLDGTLDD